MKNKVRILFCPILLLLVVFFTMPSAHANSNPVEENSALTVDFPNTAINVCIGQTTNLPVTISGGTGPYTYAWTLNGTLSTQTGSTFTYTGTSTPPQSTPLSVVVTDTSNGMTGNASTSLLNVTSLSLVSVSDRTICDGITVLIGSIANAPGTSYVWQVNGTTTSTTPDFMYTSDGSGVANVTVTATGAPGCSATDSFVWTEVVNPTVSIGTTTSICDPGTVVNMDASPSNAGSGDTYSYSWNTTPAATTAAIAPVISDTSFVYEVTVTNTATTCEGYAARWITYNNIQLSETHTDVTCLGQNDGAIDLTATQVKTAPLSYSWQNVTTGSSLNSTQDQTGLSPGSYQVTVQDGSCNRSLPNPVIITQPSAALAVTGSTTDPSSGLNNGAIDITATGGTPPYTYAWSNSTTVEDLTALAAGTYSVTVTDSRNCTATNSFTLTAIAPLSVSITSQTNILCNGQSTGTIDIAVTGGTTPYTYAWSNSATIQDLAGLPAGSYTVTVTDAASATATQTVNLTQSAAIAISQQSITPTSSPTATDGAIDINVTGGNGTYTYAWQNSGGTSVGTTQDITGLAAGVYNVTVTDGNSCTATQAFTVTSAAALTLTLDNSTNPTCANGTNGAISITVNSGTAPYTFVWTTSTNTSFSTLEDLTGLAAETYNVTVTDTNGQTASLSSPIVLTAPAAISVAPTAVNVTCNGASTGSITLTVTNGTAPYTYAWSNSATTAQINSLSAGTYAVTVTDANTCTGTATGISITEPAAITLMGNVTNPNNSTSNNGAIDLTVMGGTSPYQVLWSNSATTEDLSGLVAGTYNVTVTDANNCTQSVTYTVVAPVVITIAGSTNPACNGDMTGSINLTISGGNSPYTYAWSDGSTAEDRTGLGAGNYTITVTDANSATAMQTITLTQPNALTSTNVLNNVNCFGTATGSITVTPAGGTSPYTYAWSNSTTQNTISTLSAGAYSLTITDANNCQDVSSYNITQPTVLQISGTTTNVTVSGQSTGGIDLTVMGGTPAYTFAWSNSATTEDLVNVTAGSYSVTVTDANGCTQNSTFTITEPAALVVTLGGTNPILCNGDSNGAIQIGVNGGVTPYQFLWSNNATIEDLTALSAGTYQVTVTDANGATASLTQAVVLTEPSPLVSNGTVSSITCNGANDGSISLSPTGGTIPYTYAWTGGTTSASLTGLSVGAYSVTVTDANNCQTISNYNITQPTVLQVSGTITNVTISGQSTGGVDLTVTGGTLAYTFAWSNSTTTEDLTNVAAGSYSVTVTDANGCTQNSTFTITEPPLLVVTFQGAAPVFCNGDNNGAIDINVNGGVMPYQFLWSNNATTEDITALFAGTYQVTVTDANGATASFPQPYVLAQPDPLLGNGTVNNATCNGGNNGSILLNPTGGTAPYTYAWTGGTTDASLTGLTAGTYSVTISDQSSCQTIENFTVTESTALTLTPVITPNNCNGASAGQINVTVTGGTPPYTSFQWSNGATTAMNTGLAAGSYTLVVTDTNGCTQSETYTLVDPNPIVLNLSTNNATCGQATGSVTLGITGGTSPYTAMWSNGTSSLTGINGLSAGNYSVTITDANGCTSTQSADVNNNDGPGVSVSNQTNIACFGETTGAVTTAVNGGTAPFTYLWSNGATTSSLVNLTVGSYTLTVTDANTCTAIVTASITQNAPLVIVVPPTNVSCFGAEDGAANPIVSGGVIPYTFAWSTGATTQNISGLSAGTYTVTMTDAANCTQTTTATIGQPTEITATAQVTEIDCAGASTGGITVTAMGGTGTLNYTWSDNATAGATRTGLAAGNYALTITDQSNCFKTFSYQLNNPTTITISNLTPVGLGCAGGSTGSVSLNVEGGSGTYAYNWSSTDGTFTQQTTVPTLSGLAAGTYSVAVSNANGTCTVSENFEITAAGTISVSNAITTVNCAFVATINSTGGTSPFTYTIAPNPTNASGTNNIFTGLPAGNYTVNVTDAAGCSGTTSFTIGGMPMIAVTSNITNASCANGTDGTITLSSTETNLTYQWSDTNIGNTATANNLAAGAYSVTVSNAVGCQEILNLNVTAPTEITITQTNLTNPTCGETNGSITISAAGGTAPYTYAWSAGMPNNSTTVGSLASGSYSVTVTDNNNCTSVAMYNLNASDAPSATATTTNVLCFGANDGTITVTAMGGTGTLSYSLNGGTGQATPTFSGLSAGSYTVTVADQAGCSFVLNNLQISAPTTALTVSVTTNPATSSGASDGSAGLTIAGGVSPYKITWSNGAEDITILNNLSAGSYSVTVNDAAGMGCMITENFTITSNASPLSLSTSLTNVSCVGGNNGAISLEVTGGLAPYSIVWTYPNGSTVNNMTTISNLLEGSYNLAVTDANNLTANFDNIEIGNNGLVLTGSAMALPTCDGVTTGGVIFNAPNAALPLTYSYTFGGSAQTLTDNDAAIDTLPNLAAGTYSALSLTDNNGCMLAFADQTVSQLSAVTIAVDNTTNVTCNGNTNGAATISASGGTPSSTYSYLWNSATGTQVSTTNAISGVGAGAYIVTATDASGCTATQMVNISEPDMIAVNFTTMNVNCFGESTGTVTVAGVTGGNGTNTWVWSGGFPNNQAEITGLAAGDYSLTVTDMSGCTNSATATVTTPTAALTVTTSATGANCFGQSNGSITLNPQGGTPNYTYAWNNSAASGGMPTGLPAGDYTATVTDMNGCTTQAMASVVEPNALTFSAATTDPACANEATGAINLTVGGGVADYQYNWGDATTEDRTNLPAGMYTVTVSYNQSGGSFLCDTVANFTLTSPTPITAQSQADSIACNGNTNGAITVTATGGTGDLTYAWNTGATTANLTGLGVGTYTLGIVDANNCMITVVDSIAQPNPIAVTSEISRAGCKGPSSGGVNISATGGTLPYTYAWSNSTSSEDLSNVAGGTYQVTLTDARMCTFQGNYTVETSDTIFTPLFVVATGLENVDSVQVNESDSLQFKDLSFPTPTSWQWEFGEGSTSTLQNPRFSYPNNTGEMETSYTAKLIVGNEFCKDSLSKTILITNNMRLNAPQEDELVYLQFTEVSAVPNPVMNYLNLTVELNREQATEVTLYDTSGKMHTREILEGDDRYEHQIDVSGLTRGMYFLRVKALQQVHTLKIVVAGY